MTASTLYLCVKLWVTLLEVMEGGDRKERTAEGTAEDNSWFHALALTLRCCKVPDLRNMHTGQLPGSGRLLLLHSGQLLFQEQECRPALWYLRRWSCAYFL